ncbi:hypothetical protein PGT21_026222 [Puccinia graminis f. sp. tritici]|uniref:Uncharacterized protein n=1 Tax=Puccinia graminis f. sp. tritici TaxID=56615 RepID=A0A5B0NM68_PUCGR|nr:hypothetical protein PGT21_026222 [Puccinia graminis f. sp. tritici]
MIRASSRRNMSGGPFKQPGWERTQVPVFKDNCRNSGSAHNSPVTGSHHTPVTGSHHTSDKHLKKGTTGYIPEPEDNNHGTRMNLQVNRRTFEMPTNINYRTDYEWTSFEKK